MVAPSTPAQTTSVRGWAWVAICSRPAPTAMVAVGVAAALPGPQEGGLGDRVVQPRLAAALDEVQPKLRGDGCGGARGLRVQRQRGAARGDALEQPLGVEVEPGQFLRREHPDGEAR